MNFLVVLYFISIALINFFKIDFVLIGVFRELLTIPFLIALLVLVFIGVKNVMTQPRNRLNSISVFLLIITTCLTIGSFF